MIRRRMRDEEVMHDSLEVEDCIMVNFPLVPLTLVFFSYSSCFKVLSAKKKLNNHIGEMHTHPKSCILF